MIVLQSSQSNPLSFFELINKNLTLTVFMDSQATQLIFVGSPTKILYCPILDLDKPQPQIFFPPKESYKKNNKTIEYRKNKPKLKKMELIEAWRNH